MRDEKKTKMKAALPMAAHGAFAMDSPVPQHGPMILLGGGLMGIGLWGRGRKRMQE